MRTILIACAAWVTLCQAGCANYTQPPAQARLTPTQKNFDSLWQASLVILRDYHFTIDRTDRRAGVIETFPMVGQQWMEFWRRDAMTPYDLLENSLQGVTRKVTVRILGDKPASAPATRPAEPGRFHLVVEVTVARGSDPISVTRTIDGYYMFLMPGREEEVRRHMLEQGLLPQPGDEQAPAPPPGRTIAQDSPLAKQLTRDIRREADREYASFK